jgi:hypothetical protein
MRLPDGTVLMHGKAPYDPVKAHEYYIRTRQLKGRRPAAATFQPTVRTRSRSTFTVRLPSGKTVLLTQEQLNQQREVAAKRVAAIKENLVKLTNELRARMREAKNKQQEAARKVKKAPTAAEQAKAAREAKKYRAKNRQQLSNKAKAAAAKAPSKPKTDPVAELQVKIEDVRSKLSAAVAHQRSLMAATKPATRGR